MYTKKIASNGRTMYHKNGKLVSRKDIPEEEVWRLEGLDPEQVKQMLSSKTLDQAEASSPLLNQGPVCIFCEKAATTSRFINGASAQLCEEDYKIHTTGEIVEQVRKNEESKRKNSTGSAEAL